MLHLAYTHKVIAKFCLLLCVIFFLPLVVACCINCFHQTICFLWKIENHKTTTEEVKKIPKYFLKIFEITPRI